MRFVVATIMPVAGLAFAPMACAQDKAPTAKPIGSPGAWIPANGYPPAAKASAEEGRVAFTLTIDETGRASDCKITTSSDSPLLDETTCSYMIANGRFEAPKDKRGRPVASRWNSSVRWKLEDTAPPATGDAAPPTATAVAAPLKPVVARQTPAKAVPIKRTPYTAKP